MKGLPRNIALGQPAIRDDGLETFLGLLSISVEPAVGIGEPIVNVVQILRAISDGHDCRGYYIWTLVDK